MLFYKDGFARNRSVIIIIIIPKHYAMFMPFNQLGYKKRFIYPLYSLWNDIQNAISICWVLRALIH